MDTIGSILNVFWTVFAWLWSRPDTTLLIILLVWIGRNLLSRRRSRSQELELSSDSKPYGRFGDNSTVPGMRTYLKKTFGMMMFIYIAALLIKTMFLYTSDHAPTGWTASVELLGHIELPISVHLYLVTVLGTIIGAFVCSMAARSRERKRALSGNKPDERTFMTTWARRLTFGLSGFALAMVALVPEGIGQFIAQR